MRQRVSSIRTLSSVPSLHGTEIVYAKRARDIDGRGSSESQQQRAAMKREARKRYIHCP